MKNLITIINLCVIFGVTTIFTTTDKSPNKPDAIGAENKTAARARKTTQSGFALKTKLDEEKSTPDEITAKFLLEVAESRLMNLEEGKTAQQRSTIKSLKEYGTLMVKDQTAMLNEIKKLAALKNVELPLTLSEDKSEGLSDLKAQHGKSFDKKFIKMMVIDHKREVKKFGQATRFKDPDIQVFATKYVPVVQSHLTKINSLKNNN